MQFWGAARGECKHVRYIGHLRAGLHEFVLDEVQDHQRVLVQPRLMQETAISCYVYVEQHAEI